ncbi:MAG: hypothetical protein Q7S06_02570 [Nanoarchaeota archaeon]|nr:hypothetical protein [Nanoarchaeota archaeon]
MSLDEVLKEISKNKKISVERIDDEIGISIEKEGLILRIYPLHSTSEFLDIEDEWTELDFALKEKYPEFPELQVLVDYMNENYYDIVW